MAQITSAHQLSSRIRGSLLGLAVCDALGGPVEFKSRGSFSKVTTLLPNDNFDLPAGCFTDDTSMALCLAQSLLEQKGRSRTVDQVMKYISWWQRGFMSSTGECFDIGVSTRTALAMWSAHLEHSGYDELSPLSRAAQDIEERGQERINQNLDQERFCGNGSLMRVVPVALVSSSPTQVDAVARHSSISTHPHLRCQEACAMYSLLAFWALKGWSKEDLAKCVNSSMPNEDFQAQVTDEVLKARFAPYRSILDWRSKPEGQIRSTGYVIDSLEASLWAFFTTDTFEEGAIKVVNLGDDADTVGAIFGGVAGAYYGINGIPKSWLDGMKRMDILNAVAERIVMCRET